MYPWEMAIRDETPGDEDEFSPLPDQRKEGKQQTVAVVNRTEPDYASEVQQLLEQDGTQSQSVCSHAASAALPPLDRE